MLHSGFPDKASYAGLKKKLQIDDYVDITINLHLQKFQVPSATATTAADKVNAVCIQFSPEMTPLNYTFQTNDYLDFKGLVVFIINEDRSTPENPNYKPFFVTYRYFPNRIHIKKDYLSMLVENQSELMSRPRIAEIQLGGQSIQNALPN